MSEWQPIETAPRDGTAFIALEGGDVYRCQWLEIDDAGRKGWWDFYCGSFENPTHWMPLPPPPATREPVNE